MEGDSEYCSGRFCDAVDELMGYLTHTLHTVVNDLKLKLYSEFTEQERQNIDGSGVDMKKVTTLFTILKTKSVGVHQKCLKALEELKHEEAADKLRERIKSPCSIKKTGPGKPNIIAVVGVRYNRVFQLTCMHTKSSCHIIVKLL